MSLTFSRVWHLDVRLLWSIIHYLHIRLSGTLSVCLAIECLFCLFLVDSYIGVLRPDVDAKTFVRAGASYASFLYASPQFHINTLNTSVR